jgi:Ca-activated chloride channel family protein
LERRAATLKLFTSGFKPMKLKVMPPIVSGALVAILMVSLLPVPIHATAQSQQSSQRRGKNGSSQADSADPSSNSAGKASTASSATGQSPGASSSQSNGQESHSSKDQTSDQTKRDPDQSSRENQDLGAGPQHRDAPPFDRPPLKTSQSQGNASSSGSAEAPSRPAQTTQPRSEQPDMNRESSPRARSTRDYDPDDEAPDRTGRQRPVLKRESDPRSSEGPPVLRRPSDQEAQNYPANRNRRPSTGPVDEDSRDPGSGGAAAGDDDVVRLESTLVNIPLLVSDRAGRYIPQLSKNDFLLWEDGAPQQIASFGSEQVPFKVALVLDVSPSVQGSIRDIQDAAVDFVRQLREQDEVMVVSFDHNIHFLSDFTNNRMQLEYAIRSASMGSGTSVYEAVYEVVDRRLRGVEGRKALILFSDGEDTTSKRVGYDDAVNVVTESDVLVYGLRYPGSDFGPRNNWPWPSRRYPYPQIPNIPLPFPWPRKRGPFTFQVVSGPPNSTTSVVPGQSWPRRRGGGDFMSDITAAGGGPVFDAKTVADMRGLAARIAEELRHVYVISYYPTNPLSNGGYRSIRVQVRNRDDIAVRHRRGYNASSGSPRH